MPATHPFREQDNRIPDRRDQHAGATHPFREQSLPRTETMCRRVSSSESTGWLVMDDLTSLGSMTGQPVHSNEDTPTAHWPRRRPVPRTGLTAMSLLIRIQEQTTASRTDVTNTRCGDLRLQEQNNRKRGPT